MFMESESLEKILIGSSFLYNRLLAEGYNVKVSYYIAFSFSYIILT